MGCSAAGRIFNECLALDLSNEIDIEAEIAEPPLLQVVDS